MTTTATDYEQQAQDFLKKWRVKFTVRATDSGKCPPFCDDSKHIHGNEHIVKLQREDKAVSFRFWNSYNDAAAGTLPTAYDVLACASSDLYCPESFEDFCAEYGFDPDSRKAEKLHARCLAQSKRLQKIFDTEEIQAALSLIN